LQQQVNNADFECEANGIVTIEIIVYDEFDDMIAFGGPFECESGEGFVSDVEAGVDLTVEVLAQDESGATIFRGEVTGVMVLAGQTTEIGPVILFPVLNRPPVLEPISPKEVLEGETVEFFVSANDPDADNRLSYSANNLPPGATFDPDEQFFQWTPQFGDAGVYQVFFRVIDNGNPPLSDSQEVTISVGNVNQPPRLDPIEDKNVSEGELLEFPVTATDPENDLLTYQASGLPPGAEFDPETQFFSWTTDFGSAGNYEVFFTVTDDGIPPRSATESVMITVGEVNRPPQLDPIGEIMVEEGALIEFTVTAQDPDADNLSFEAVNVPEGAEFDPDSQVFRWPTTTEDAGNYEVSFSVNDDGVPPQSDTITVNIIVGESNRSPVFDPVGSVFVVEDTPIRFQVTAEDPDMDELTYRAEDLPSDANFDPLSQIFSWTPGLQDAGSYTVRFIVTDDGEPPMSDEMEVNITVGNREFAPQLNPIGDKIVNLALFDGPGSLSFTVTASDLNGDPLTFNTSGLPIEGVESDGSFNPNTQQFNWPTIIFSSESGSDLGNYPVGFTVTDSTNLSDSENILIRVVYNNPPIIEGISHEAPIPPIPGDPETFVVAPGEDLLLFVNAFDPDEGDTLIYSFNGPSDAVFDSETGDFLWTPSPSDLGNSFPVTFTVRDDGDPQLSDAYDILVAVSNNNPPSFLPISDTTGIFGSDDPSIDWVAFSDGPIQFTVNASDTDPNDMLSFQMISGPEGAEFTPATRVFSWTPTSADIDQTFSIQFRVEDDGTPVLKDTLEQIILVQDGSIFLQ
ncbi:MAG: putative Ig domain-containing protein, partial [Thermodesulfobacteriota bacterium]